MSLTFRSYGYGNSTGTSFDVAQPSGLQAGDLLFLFVTSYHSAATPEVVSVPAGWTFIVGPDAVYGIYRMAGHLYWKVADAADVSSWSCSVTVSGGVRNLGIAAAYTSGLESEVDVFTSGSGGGGALTMPGVIPSSAGLDFLTFESSQCDLANPGYTLATDNPTWATDVDWGGSDGIEYAHVRHAVRASDAATGTWTARSSTGLGGVAVGVVIVPKHAGITITPHVACDVPQLLDHDTTCIEYAYVWTLASAALTDVVAVSAGTTYQVGPYVRVTSDDRASCELEAVLYDGAVATRTVSLAVLTADAEWERCVSAVTPTVGEDGLALRVSFTPVSGGGTCTLQLTAMHIVAEDWPSVPFVGTRQDTGDLGEWDLAAPGLPNELAADNGLWVWYGRRRHYEGWQVAPQLTYSGDERWYVAAGSYLDRAKRNALFGRIWQDSDLAQWQQMEDVPSWVRMVNNGQKLRILNVAGSPVPAEATIRPVASYWLMAGLIESETIDHVDLVLTKVGTPLYTLGLCYWSGQPSPTTGTSLTTWAPAEADGAKTVDCSGGTTPYAVGLYVIADGVGWTATVDNGWDVSELVVTTSAGDHVSVDLGAAMADLATLAGIADDADHALHTYSDVTVSSLVARPVTTVAAAQESLAALAAVQTTWGYEPGGIFDVQAAADPDPDSAWDRAHWWSLCSGDTTFTSDVVTDGDGFYDYVAVLYASLGVTGVKDGTVKVAYQPSTPAATDRVMVLDYGSRYMSDTEAASVGAQWLLWRGPTVSARGTQTVWGDVTDVDGHVRPVLAIAPGDWVEERERRGHRPWQVTAVHYDARGQVQVSVGGYERSFPIVAPGIGSIAADDPLGTWTDESAAAGAGTTGQELWSNSMPITTYTPVMNPDGSFQFNADGTLKMQAVDNWDSSAHNAPPYTYVPPTNAGE